MRLHLDTDLAGDPDDGCALLMLLGAPDVELVGITTTVDPGGTRAGCVRRLLELSGRPEIPVVAGAERSSSHDDVASPLADEQLWDGPVTPLPAPPGAAVDALDRAVGQGATIVAIGPLTNLAALERTRAGRLAEADVVIMGGWVDPPAPGLPSWGPEHDWNVQWDVAAAEVVAAAAGRLTLAPLPVTLAAHLREVDLPRLAATGAAGALVARQSAARRDQAAFAALGRAHPGLPDDLVNFQYDAVACAVATGWPGATVEERRLRVAVEDGVLRWLAVDDGRPVRVVTAIDAEDFRRTWIRLVEDGQRRGPG